MHDLWTLVANPWWWTVFVTMLLAGMGGGLARFVQLRATSSKEASWITCVVMGVAAAFLVPLFLNTISSPLIAESRDYPEKLFVLIGFCIAAAYFSQQFMDSVGRRALRVSQEARALARTAEDAARTASAEARCADNRAIAMWKVMQLVDEGAYGEALTEADFVIGGDPGNAECWAWKAYCHKRLAELPEAVEAIDEALRLENREVCNWLFNAACYRVLNGESFTQVKPLLQRAWHAARPAQRSEFLAMILSEADLQSARACEEFQQFVYSLQRSNP